MNKHNNDSRFDFDLSSSIGIRRQRIRLSPDRPARRALP